jgi:hypothetical protein
MPASDNSSYTSSVAGDIEHGRAFGGREIRRRPNPALRGRSRASGRPQVVDGGLRRRAE